MGHFVKHIFLVFILKANVKREIYFCFTINKGELGMAHASGEAENFLFNPIVLNLFSLVKASKRFFPLPVKYNLKLGLADQWEYNS